MSSTVRTRVEPSTSAPASRVEPSTSAPASRVEPSTSGPASRVEVSAHAAASNPLDELAARIEADMGAARRAGRYEDAARLARALAALLETAPAGVQDAPASTVKSPSEPPPASNVKATRKRRA